MVEGPVDRGRADCRDHLFVAIPMGHWRPRADNKRPSPTAMGRPGRDGAERALFAPSAAWLAQQSGESLNERVAETEMLERQAEMAEQGAAALWRCPARRVSGKTDIADLRVVRRGPILNLAGAGAPCGVGSVSADEWRRRPKLAAGDDDAPLRVRERDAPSDGRPIRPIRRSRCRQCRPIGWRLERARLGSGRGLRHDLSTALGLPAVAVISPGHTAPTSQARSTPGSTSVSNRNE